MNRLGKAKAIVFALVLLIGGNTINAENIRADQYEQRGYERWFEIIHVEEEEKNYKEVTVEISFYTDLTEENSSLGGIDAQGNPLVWGTIAVPREVPLGTKFEIEGYDNIFVARDRGSINHIRIKEDGTYRIDLFVPRKSGENNKSYWKRVNNYGKITRKAKIYTE